MKDESVGAKFLRIAAEIVANKKWRKQLAGEYANELKALDEIAKRFGGENWNTGGGIFVCVIPLGPHDCMGVTGECICRYHNSQTTDPYAIFSDPENDTGAECISLCD